MERLIERIADALERIALTLENSAETKPVKDPQPEETPFPWCEMTVALRNAERYNRAGDRPTTCEGLIRISRAEMCIPGSGWRNVGKTLVSTIDPVMERLGFGDEWQIS